MVRGLACPSLGPGTGSDQIPIPKREEGRTMALPARMKFGIFLAPFHRLGDNPTLALERDLELVQWLGLSGLRRSLGRRASQRRLGDHRLAGAVHGGGSRAHPPHQAGNRRHQPAIPPSPDGGQPHDPAGPPHPRPGDAGSGAGGAGLRCLHAGHRGHSPAGADG